MADPTPAPSGLGVILRQLANIQSRLGKLESFSGADYVRAVERIQSLIAGLPAQVDDLVDGRLSDYYTSVQVDNLVSAPGAIAPTTVTASGTVTAANVTSAGTGEFDTGVKSVGARFNVLTAGYAGAWWDIDGNAGISPSSRRLKKNITNWITDTSKLMGLQPVMFRYKTQTVDEPKQIGLIAEDVVAAGFPEFTFNDENGDVQGINYDRMAVLAIAGIQAEYAARVAAEARITALEARLTAAGIA